MVPQCLIETNFHSTQLVTCEKEPMERATKKTTRLIIQQINAAFTFH